MSMFGDEQNETDELILESAITHHETSPASALDYLLRNVQQQEPFDLQKFIQSVTLTNVINLKKTVANSKNNFVSLNRLQAIELLTLAERLYNDKAYIDFDVLKVSVTKNNIQQQRRQQQQQQVNLTQINTIQNMVNKISNNNEFRTKLQKIIDQLKNNYTESLLQNFLNVYKKYIQNNEKAASASSSKNIENIFKNIELLDKSMVESQSHDEIDKTDMRSDDTAETKIVNIELTPPPPPPPPPAESLFMPPPPPPPLPSNKPQNFDTKPAATESVTTFTASELADQKNKLTPVRERTADVFDESPKEKMFEQIKRGITLKKTNNLMQIENKMGVGNAKTADVVSDISKAIISKMEAKRIATSDESSESLSEHYDGWSDTEESRNIRNMQSNLNSKLYLLTNENVIKNEKNISELQKARKLIDTGNMNNLNAAHDLLSNYQDKLRLKYDKMYTNPLIVKENLLKPLYLTDIDKFKIAIDDLINRRDYSKALEELEIAQSANVRAQFMLRTMQHLKNLIKSEIVDMETEV
ncbi:unknown [Euproctis pseudoconspersa nucleopolyhedrovirus]|uniref:WH2 domain-containing protein n=1 Tax=Euproctis pseudoconspersa nucleopolyhedrovirus TaxID=307467 RepID=C3TWR0_9ABAC|nr:hypothetical protein EupsNPV_gp002 [Euproctis pseudoconspersa nucleopolyhedrovirus]ACO53452.1 unknown [Euproctis pseudoconspersa nucleopolyhedrovirus]